MALISTAADTDGLECSTFAPESLPRFKMMPGPISKDAAYQMISDELMLDGNPRINLDSSVTTWMEPVCEKLIMQAINKNYVDMDEYPVTTELQNRCLNIIANLFHAPLGDGEEAVGIGTVGSSEAIMLAGLVFKRKWQNKRKAERKPYDKPNIVTSANVQVCWEKFARYFEVERKEVKLKDGHYVMNPAEAVNMVDENTICVVAILGSPYNGQFEDVKGLNNGLVGKGWETPIHVDATNGGFVAPFLQPDLEWDFQLQLVKSINVSGQKYGLVYPRIGWVIWKTKQDLPEEPIFPINYLGADWHTFTPNFSKGPGPYTPAGPSQIVAQYYQFIRLGLKGYRNVLHNCANIAKDLATDLQNTGRFSLLSEKDEVPLVAFSLKDSSRYNEYEISDHLRRLGWIVSAYRMAPDAQHVNFLRVVVRQDFSRSLAKRLVRDIEKVLQYLDALTRKLTGEVMNSSLQGHLQLEGNTDMKPPCGHEADRLSPNSGIKLTDSPSKLNTQTPPQPDKKRRRNSSPADSPMDSDQPSPHREKEFSEVASQVEDGYQPPTKKQEVSKGQSRSHSQKGKPTKFTDISGIHGC